MYKHVHKWRINNENGKKAILCSSMCLTMLGQMISVSASTVSSGVQYNSGMSCYTLYMYTSTGSQELGVMQLYRDGSNYGINAFTNSNKAAPQVSVWYNNSSYQKSNGNTTRMHERGYYISVPTSDTSSSGTIYGNTNVGY